MDRIIIYSKQNRVIWPIIQKFSNNNTNNKNNDNLRRFIFGHVELYILVPHRFGIISKYFSHIEKKIMGIWIIGNKVNKYWQLAY